MHVAPNWHIDTIEDKAIRQCGLGDMSPTPPCIVRYDTINEELTITMLQRQALFEPLKKQYGSVIHHEGPPRYTHSLFMDEESMKNICKVSEESY